MQPVELLAPAGNMECLRAAVHNGADAVYLGLSKFNARSSAENFNSENIYSVVEFCHSHDVRVYVTLNTLVKNNEMTRYLQEADIAAQAGVDAVIIQDPCLVDVLKENFPKMGIHLSTQATVVNKYSIPANVDRVILARELDLEEISKISSTYETEVFVHGALCLSYSGQCLFSSMVAKRSGNRGTCSQPCRRKYNNKFPLSTKDLCLLPELPMVMRTGVRSLKIEGRMRSAMYVATTVRIYRKAIDSHGNGKFTYSEQDMKDLMLAFNREFTTGFAFNDSIVDNRQPMNRGLYLGRVQDGKVVLKEPLKVGDGIGIWTEDGVIGHRIGWIHIDGKKVAGAESGEEVAIDLKNAAEDDPIYKTSSISMTMALGDDIPSLDHSYKERKLAIAPVLPKLPNGKPKIFVKAHSKKEALDADKAGADIVYYNILKKDIGTLKGALKNAELFLSTPRIMSSTDVEELYDTIQSTEHDGLLIGERGMLMYLQEKGYKKPIHLDHTFNIFNDLDMSCYLGLPIISPELTFEEIRHMHNKDFIVQVHGDIVLMNTQEPIKAPELVDDQGAHFKVRKNGDITEVLNSKQLGLFNMSKQYLDIGVRYFYIDLSKDSGKFVRIYRDILSGKNFDDKKIKKGYTTGHFSKGV